MNSVVLMSGAQYFDDAAPINPFMGNAPPINHALVQQEHDTIKHALEAAGITVIQVDPPPHCQDGVYTANWAVVRDDIAILARLPNARQAEEAYAAKVLTALGKKVVRVPGGLKFSGQGDALACGTYLFTNSGYRSDPAAHVFVAQTLGYELVSLQTVPLTDELGAPLTNAYSGWPDSFFYDIDLALAVLRAPSATQQGLIAWCPDAFMPGCQKTLRACHAVDKIEVSLAEAKEAFACNLLSTGATVIMSAHAPQLRAAIESHGLRVVPLAITELAKGGGYIRCTTLTLA